ncbi:ABC transporter B family member 11-like [Capsicum galapagoense]
MAGKNATGRGIDNKETKLLKSLLNKTEKQQAAAADKVPYYKLFSFADPIDYALMAIGTITAVGSGVFLPLMGVLFGEMIYSFGKNAGEVSKVAVKFIYLGLGSGLATFGYLACWTVTGERQAARIRCLYMKTVLRKDIGFFDQETNNGVIIESLSSDILTVQDAIGKKVGKFIQVSATFIVGLIIAFIKGWRLALVLLSSIPPLVFSSAVLTVLQSRVASLPQTANSEAATVVEQTISSIRTVASYNGERRAISQYHSCLNKAYRSGVQEGQDLAPGIYVGGYYFFYYTSYALAIWYGSKMVLDHNYTGGDVMNVIIDTLVVSLNLRDATLCSCAFAAGRAAASKIFQTINREPVIDPYDMKGKKLLEISGGIELKNVHFCYPARPQEIILDGFSVSIPKGTTTALVGRSGSGKSTVISLIVRFYDPQAGEVLIDGINIKKFQFRWIRGKIGLGLDTRVGDHGSHLSGVQKQRIAIARAILKDPKILLLDEATSALDAESERIVQETLDSVMVNRTTVIVAHRLSTVKNADTIAVLQEGKVIEKGSHLELMRNKEGAYVQLIQLQELSKYSGEQESNELDCMGSSRTKNSSHHLSPISVSDAEKDVGKRHFTNSTAVKRKDKDNTFCRLALMSRPEIPELLLGCIAAVVNALILPIFGLLLAYAIKTFYEPAHELRKHSRFLSLIAVGLGLASLVAASMKTFFFAVAGCKLIKRIRLMCFEQIVYMEISWFDSEANLIAIGSQLSTDAASVRGIVGSSLDLLVQNTSTAIAGLVIGLEASWKLTLIMIVMVPLIGLNEYLHVKLLSALGADAKKLYEDASQVASEAVGSIRTVASFSVEEKVVQLYERKCEGPVRAGIKEGLLSSAGFGFSMFCWYYAYAVSFYASARLIESGKVTFAEVLRVFYGLIITVTTISRSIGLAPDFTKAKTGASSIFALLDRKSNFNYPSRPEVQVLKDLCLAINSGQMVALVGENGSGKSTVISLLQRFYDPDSGLVTLDGIEFQKLNAEIFVAAKLSNAHSFISGLLQGYETLVGERGTRLVGEWGTRLSGGQKQRVAIARAIVKNPKILLLDEATSALDSESEKLVQDALHRVRSGRTTVVVAHRLSSIKDADVIAVIKDGVIVEKGNHETLVKRQDGVYASLVSKSASTMK